MNVNKYIFYTIGWLISLALAFLYGSATPRFIDISNEITASHLSSDADHVVVKNINLKKSVPQTFTQGFTPEMQRGLEALAATTDPNIFEYRLNEILKGLRLEDFPRFLAEVNMVFDRENVRSTVVVATLAAWAERDLLQALEKTHEFEDSNPDLWWDAIVEIAPIWAASDPYHAMEWFFANLQNYDAPTRVLASEIFKHNMDLFTKTILAKKPFLSPREQTNLLATASRNSYSSMNAMAPLIDLFDNLDIEDPSEERRVAQNIVGSLYKIDRNEAIEWLDSLANEEVQVGALNEVVGSMDKDELLTIYDRVQHWELSSVARTKATTDILLNLTSEDYATAKSLYLSLKDQADVKITIEDITHNIDYQWLPPEQAPLEIAFWLNEVTDIKERDALARRILIGLNENRPDFHLLKSQITKHIYEEYEEENQIIVLPPW